MINKGVTLTHYSSSNCLKEQKEEELLFLKDIPFEEKMKVRA